jgi:lysophospholipase L1-like esterase
MRGIVGGTIAMAFVLPVSVWAQDLSPVRVADYKAAIKVACVGDSITYGVGADGGQSWPDQLGRMLGDKWDAKNFGVSGTTLMNSGDGPYQKQSAFKDAKDFNPDVVVIALGTNDTKPDNWAKFKKDFEVDYKDLVGQFAALAGKPRIFICRPPYIARDGNFGINDSNTVAQIPVIDKVAKELKLGLIDLHAALKGKDDMIPDNVHPNNDGANAIAQAVFNALAGKDGSAQGK